MISSGIEFSASPIESEPPKEDSSAGVSAGSFVLLEFGMLVRSLKIFPGYFRASISKRHART